MLINQRFRDPKDVRLLSSDQTHSVFSIGALSLRLILIVNCESFNHKSQGVLCLAPILRSKIEDYPACQTVKQHHMSVVSISCRLVAQFVGYGRELLEGGLEVVGDFLGEDFWIGEIVGVF